MRQERTIQSLHQEKKEFRPMSNSGAHHHVCFYSNKCRWSEAFIKAVAGTPFKHELQFVCVDADANGNRPKLPPWLKKVPTLIVRGESEARTDGDVMNWVSEKKLLTKAPDAQSTEPEPWVGTEMGGSLTKGFSFIGANDTNDAPIGNFEFLNGQTAQGVRTAAEMPGGGLGARAQNKSKKEQMFDSQMEEYMRQRGSGMPQAPMRQ
jgi:hypothetical protein